MDLFSLPTDKNRACEAAMAAAAAAAAVEIPKEEGNKEAGGSRIIMTASSSSINTTENPLAALLAHQRYIINDGGMGTLLEALIGEPLDPKLW